ncbi:lactate dehydrogenase [Clostridiaceae bacterium M8S5]|nr:lactate dehydrogenase [Clostridiaceae bacterium M8S5]
MYLYEFQNKLLVSLKEIDSFKKYTDNPKKYEGKIYFVFNMNPKCSRKFYSITDPELLFINTENLNLIKKLSTNICENLPDWFLNKISDEQVMAVNMSYPNWEECLSNQIPKKWNINILALGDVGSTLLIGLRLLGGNYIDNIGIYDRSENKLNRWEQEINQIYSAFDNAQYPNVSIIKYDELFDCDMFIFCASKGVPPVGKEHGDVRMAQYEANAKIISQYANMARNKSFKGIFAVVSDPVDLLCKTVFLESNRNSHGLMDFKGLSGEQIRGYGLGVMNARACYYANKDNAMKHYITDGRAFGPHGEGLVIADSIENYNDEISKTLTHKAKTANISVRNTGYKPYIAPALSSGSLSIISTIAGKYHYSSTFMGGVFMGAKNKLSDCGVVLERLDLNSILYNRLLKTYQSL